MRRRPLLAVALLLAMAAAGAVAQTCDDKIQNGDETGVDCGGSCDACPTCDDGIQNGNETDVDCGGTCPNGCRESQKCIVNQDCDVDAGGCLNNGICYDSTDAKIVTGFMFVFIWVALGLLVLHSSQEIKMRLFNCKMGYARAEKKRKEAEAEHQRGLERAQKLTEKEANDRDAAIGLSVWKSRSGSLDGMDDGDVELYDVEAGEADDGDEWDLDGAVDGGNDDYAHQVLRQRSLEGGEGKVAGAGDDDDDEDMPALMPRRLGAKKVEEKQARKVRPPGRAELIEIGAQMREEALKHREQHLPELLELNVVAKSHAGLVRQSIAIINATTSILAPLRLKAVTQLRILSVAMLKKYGLLNMTGDQVDEAIVSVQRAANRIGWALNNTRDIDNSRKTLHDSMKIVRRVAKVVRSPRKGDVMEPVETVIDKWQLTDPQFLVAQLDAEADLASHDDRVQQMFEKVMLARTPFVTSNNVNAKNDEPKSFCARLPSMVAGSIFPPALRAYPQFYALFFAGMAIIFARFAFRIGVDSNQEVQDVGTFLPVPPYYQLEKHEHQRTLVPLIYAFMHSALYCFCWLPLAFARGVLRDLSNTLPRLRRFAPLDDMVFFHKLLGVITLLFLFIGGVLFYISLADECREGDVQSCIAFDPLNPDNGLRERIFTHNPFKNVVALRKTVWFTWFPIFPLLHWAHIEPPRFLPNVLRLYWFEFVFYTHHFVAHVSFLTAQICRFDVFYPALVTWGIYYLDTLREMILNTHATHVAIHPALQSGDDSAHSDSSVIHTDQTGRPTLVNLRIDKPIGFTSGAGQIVYLKVPEISRVQWHPFSIASASQDDHIELQIGVIGGKPDQWAEQQQLLAARGRELARIGSAERILAPRVPDAQWKMKNRPTWTYKLQELVRARITELNFLDDPEGQADHVAPIKVLVRGPYGSPFTRCFSPAYTGCVIIGAGTGLTAAISVLREIIDRRKRGKATPPYVWFVWSCKRADDLLWMWDALQELVLEALNDGVLRPGPNWTPQSNMLDWLSVTVYVTRANQKILDKFLADQTKREQPKLDENNARALRAIVDEDEKMGLDKDESIDDGLDQAGAAGGGPAVARFLSLRNSRERDADAALLLSQWLSSDKHTLRGSPDEPDIHIGKLLKWARVYVNRKAGRHKKMTACFCGPPALAHILHDAASDIGAGMEFSAEHQ